MNRLPRTALALSISLACAALLAASGPAHAQLVIESGPPPQHPAAVVQPAPPPATVPAQAPTPAAISSAPVPQPYWVPPVLTQPVPALASGWGKDEPFSLATRQIVPQGWDVHDESLGAVKDARVSWRGGAPWPQVLEGLASSQSVSVRLDWKARQAWLSLSGSAPAAAPSVASAQPSAHTAASPHATSSVTLPSTQPKSAPNQPISAAAPAPKTAAVEAGKPDVSRSVAPGPAVTAPPPAQFTVDHSVPPPPPAPSWTLDSSMTLRQNVEAWAKRAGWHVVWNAADYPVIAPATFAGTFASPTGPLAQLIEGYKGSDQPLIAHLTTMDHVVYVYDSHYTPAEVKPATASSLAPGMFDIYGTLPGRPAQGGPPASPPASSVSPPPPDPQAVEAGSRLPPLVIGSTPSKH